MWRGKFAGSNFADIFER
jgi:hypothetical protein